MNILSLLIPFAEQLLQAEKELYEHPDQLAAFERSVADSSHRTAADFMSMVLTDMDERLCENSLRKEGYNIQRQDRRTLITTVGDVRFPHTLFLDKETKKCRYLLDEVIGLPAHERFSSLAEAKMLYEAEVHSYRHAAESLTIGEQTVSKTAVMGKVHRILEDLPEEAGPAEEEKKQCEYLYIEADEDHISRQKGDPEKGSLLGKLVYLFEGKEEICKGKRILVGTHYHGGLYAGSKKNRQLWEEVQRYIETHYDTEALRRVYICSDGGGWIKAGKDCIDKSVLVADRYHLMKYINRASGLMLDEEEETKKKFYRYIHRNELQAVEKLLTRIKNSAGQDERIEEIRTYFIHNWEAIRRAFHDRHALGCSAEGHVSNVLSERMSSRPMGWSERGSDRMCKLRCYVRNHGKEGIIDLVEYRRQKKREALKATGTDGMVEAQPRKRYTQAQRQVMIYAEKMQASIAGDTVRKTLAIREHLNNL